MGIPVLIIGESGTGKSASLRRFDEADVGVINVSGKPLPFRKRLKTVVSDDYGYIIAAIGKSKAKSIVIDDSQYLMVNGFMRRIGERGYDKFTDIAGAHWMLIQYVINQLPADKIVYFMSHIERDVNGNEKAKTVGKMIDQYITLEGLFSIVLKTKLIDGRYVFQTHNSGYDTVKSPLDMFTDDVIDNDLKTVDETIRKYYEIQGENDIVLDPFAGIGSTNYTALRMGRRTVGIELKGSYYKQAVANTEAAKEQSIIHDLAGEVSEKEIEEAKERDRHQLTFDELLA